MFRRVFTTAAKLTAGLGSVQLGAAAVALTDKQLNKKPAWYKESVLRLEESVKKLGTYAWIDDHETLEHAEDVLKSVADLEECEILWRFARVHTEKAMLSKSHEEKKKLLHEAVHIAKKAVALQSEKGSAGANKWYAISLMELLKNDKLEKKQISLAKESIKESLNKAIKLDDKDPFTWHVLGVFHYENKDYKEAIKNFEKAESIRAGFSPLNLYYLGETQRHLGNKQAAKELHKRALATHTRNIYDRRAQTQSKSILLSKLKAKPEECDMREW